MSSSDSQPKRSKLLKQELYEFFSGCAGGIAQVIIGQPVDIIKVRLQTQPPEHKIYDGMWDCITKIYKAEGPLAFYKGTLPPLLGVAGCVSIQFEVFESAKRFFKKRHDSINRELALKYVYLSGSIAGLANSVISIPVEHLRIRMQAQGLAAREGRTYSGSIDCARDIYHHHGIKGIFKGTNITLIREVFCFGLYFWTYEVVVRSLLKPGQDKNDLGPGKLCLAGALAGYFWLVGFPIDLIKSKIQTDSFINPRYKSIWGCVVQTKKEGGMSGFYKGLTPCIVRTGPVNAGSFIVFEYSMRFLTNTHHKL